MAAPKRLPIQISRDRKLIADLYCQGWIQADIAEYINKKRDYTLTQQMISYDIKRIQAEWLKSSLIDLNTVKAQELGKIDRLEREYWSAWIESKKDAEIFVERGKGADATEGDTTIETVHTRKGQVGDPRFLDGVNRCREQRCKIIGLYAPTKVAPTDPTGEKEFSGLTDEERVKRIVALLALGNGD